MKMMKQTIVSIKYFQEGEIQEFFTLNGRKANIRVNLQHCISKYIIKFDYKNFNFYKLT